MPYRITIEKLDAGGQVSKSVQAQMCDDPHYKTVAAQLTDLLQAMSELDSLLRSNLVGCQVSIVEVGKTIK